MRMRGALAALLLTCFFVASLPPAPPAAALVCSPALGSLCSPAGLTLAAEGQIVGLGTATVGTGASTATATAGAATASSGVAGISFGTLATATGGAAAAVGVAGWQAGWFEVRGNGASGLNTAAPQAGWVIGPTYSFSGWERTDTATYTDGRARLTVEAAPNFGDTRGNDDIVIRYDLQGDCNPRAPKNYTSFPAPVVRGVWVTDSGRRETGSALSVHNWPGKCTQTSLLSTGGANGSVGGRSKFSHLEISLGVETQFMDRLGSIAPSSSTTGGFRAGIPRVTPRVRPRRSPEMARSSGACAARVRTGRAPTSPMPSR